MELERKIKQNEILCEEDLDFYNLTLLSSYSFDCYIYGKDNNRLLIQQIREGKDPLYEVILSYENE
jgi:hypothetical protein